MALGTGTSFPKPTTFPPSPPCLRVPWFIRERAGREPATGNAQDGPLPE